MRPLNVLSSDFHPLFYSRENGYQTPIISSFRNTARISMAIDVFQLAFEQIIVRQSLIWEVYQCHSMPSEEPQGQRG